MDNALATATIATSEAAMAECVRKAAELEGNLDTANWDIFDAVDKLTDERQAAGQEILAEVRQALESDEHVVGLAAAFKGAQAKAVRLLTKAVDPPRTPTQTTKIIHEDVKPGRRIVDRADKLNLTLQEAKDALSELDGKLKPGQSVRVNLNWLIEEGSDGA